MHHPGFGVNALRLVRYPKGSANPFCALFCRTRGPCAACYALQQRLERLALSGTRTLTCFAGLTLIYSRAFNGGRTDSKILPIQIAQSMGYVSVGLHVDPNDWQRPPADVIVNSVLTQVSDPNPDALSKLKGLFPNIGTAAGNNAVPAAQDIIFLAVHPPAIPDVAAAVKGQLKGDALFVSLAPKFTIAKLTDLLGGFSRIARVLSG